LKNIGIGYKPCPMKIDPLKQYVASRDSLVKEKTALELRLAQINKALGSNAPAVAAKMAPTAAPAAKRVKNALSLKEAAQKVTSARPLTKKEILAGVKKIGYRFGAKDPMNSLNVILYTKGNFKNEGGKFSPLK